MTDARPDASTGPDAAPAAALLVVAEHRARLLEGMARAVAAKGYADTTIADIVREASVSRRTFYENFGDKAECLLALYEAASGNAIAALRAAIDPLSPWEQQVAQAMAAYLGVLQSNPVLLRTLFIDILGMGVDGLTARRRANQQLADLMLDVVNNRDGVRLRKAPLQPLMAVAVVGGINEMVLQLIERGRTAQLQELVEPAASLVRAAISSEF
jgi:AcrR family transcriptional regulator